ncbi:DUF982 domain-containing protein [Mesorhizobium muleiense]|nr:DUF982 domain-containing protein [Mesorhizobium muleiense]
MAVARAMLKAKPTSRVARRLKDATTSRPSRYADLAKRGSRTMGKFLPLLIRFVDGRLMQVSSITEAELALAGQWPNKEADVYREAARLLVAAREGTCTPDIAFIAFEKAARQQRLLKPRKPSSGLRILDSLSESN